MEKKTLREALEEEIEDSDVLGDIEEKDEEQESIKEEEQESTKKEEQNQKQDDKEQNKNQCQEKGEEDNIKLTPKDNTLKIEIKQPNLRRKVKRLEDRIIDDDEEIQEVALEDVKGIMEAFEPLSTGIYFHLERLEPRTFNGKNTSGFLEKITDPIEPEDIKRRYGGGKYALHVLGPKVSRDGTLKGNKIISRKVFRVAGDPIVQEMDIVTRREDSNLTKQNLEHSSRVMEAIRKDKELEAKRADLLLEKIIEMKNNDSSGKEMIALLTTMLQSNQEMMRSMQEERRRAEEKHQEELRMMQERHHAQLEALKKETQTSLAQTVTPFISLMEKSREDSKSANEIMIKMLTTLAENNAKMIAENAQRQLQMVQETSKSQVNLLTNELKRISEELKEARNNSKNDLVSEIKKFRVMQEILGGEKEEQSTFDKIAERIPDITGLLGNIKEIVSPRIEQRVIRKPVPPPQRNVSQQQVKQLNNPQVKQENIQSQVQVPENISKMLDIFKSKISEAINNEISVHDFYEKEIASLDKNILGEILKLNIDDILQFIERFSDPESILLTVKGRNYIKDLFAELKRRMNR